VRERMRGESGKREARREEREIDRYTKRGIK